MNVYKQVLFLCMKWLVVGLRLTVSRNFLFLSFGERSGLVGRVTNVTITECIEEVDQMIDHGLFSLLILVIAVEATAKCYQPKCFSWHFTSHTVTRLICKSHWCYYERSYKIKSHCLRKWLRNAKKWSKYEGMKLSCYKHHEHSCS